MDKDFLMTILVGLIKLIPWILIGALIVGYVYAVVKYGNTPVSEMPVWVYLLFKK